MNHLPADDSHELSSFICYFSYPLKSLKNQYKDEEHVEHNTLSLVSDAVRVKGDKFGSIFWSGLPSPHQMYFLKRMRPKITVTRVCCSVIQMIQYFITYKIDP